mgnify:CR=1 FL=1
MIFAHNQKSFKIRVFKHEKNSLFINCHLNTFNDFK